MARGIAGVDAAAIDLVPPIFAAAMRSSPRAVRAWNFATLGLVDHIELRTRHIDEALRAAGAVEQLVILGAGLDARAYRVAELAKTVVFEVDHPSTQLYKREKVARREPLARAVRFVPVDFEHDSLEVALEAAGHEAAKRTFWIWEGVTPYLHLDAIRVTLGHVARRSARGSRIATSYATPDGSPLGPAFVRFALATFRVVGEEIRGMMTPEQMASELGAAGFEVLTDDGTDGWARAAGEEKKKRILLVNERIVVAEKG
jgi:methyltransferase (TIGR00027 family)